jgi:putative ABC transport system permease protein
VASDGTTDFIAAASVLPSTLGSQLSELPDVKTVSPLIVRPVEVYKEGGDPHDTFDIQLVGYNPITGLGGPLSIVEGKNPLRGEVVIDKETSRRRHINIGDHLVRGNKSLVVVGKSQGGDFVYTQVAFSSLDSAIDFLNLEPKYQRTFFVLRLDDPGQRDLFTQRATIAIPGVKFITGAKFADATRDRILSNILPILIVVLIVAFVVGLAVAALTIYTATVEKSREYGILKAEGFTNLYLYRVVFEQSIITSILGFLLGAGATLLVAPLAQDRVPQFVVFVRWEDISMIAVSTLVMALLAAYIPVRRLASIDPVAVFKG